MSRIVIKCLPIYNVDGSRWLVCTERKSMKSAHSMKNMGQKEVRALHIGRYYWHCFSPLPLFFG